MRQSKAAPPAKRLRCGVYTRKSSEEGLDQEFNSLHAQREACDAFIASQRQEGWIGLAERYDDGGFSGGTTDRPGLQRLLADIAAGQVQVVVVYKVDRLTRSLADFAKLVELFDAHGVSFVSVTQAFNTTTSMGRLTLNVLLSFAQFEREVTGERIRDKIAASKKKGMWMGGQPPLGYDVAHRKLVVNEPEAETVRHIFRRYAALRSVQDLKVELDAAGIVSKRRLAPDGTPYGGQPIGRGALYLMLANRIYRGEIVHKGTVYPGEHAAIVDEELFGTVGAILTENRVERIVGGSKTSLLTGLIYDADGERLTPSHANKKGTRYRYYVSRHLITGSKGKRGQRLPAAPIEAIVRDRIAALLADPAPLLDRAEHRDAAAQHRLDAAAAGKARIWAACNRTEHRTMLMRFVRRVEVHPDRVVIATDPVALAAWLLDHPGEAPMPQPEGEPLLLTVPIRLQQRGVEMRFVLDSPTAAPAPDRSIARLIARAHKVAGRVMTDRASLDDVGNEEGLGASYVTRLIRLTFLAPDIQARLLSGQHDPSLTAKQLMSDTRLPLAWAEQRAILRLA